MFTFIGKILTRAAFPTWLYEASGEVRNDLAIHRVERMRCVAWSALGYPPQGSPTPTANSPAAQYLISLFIEYDRLKDREAVLRGQPGLLRRVRANRKPRLALAKYNRDNRRYGQVCRRLHHVAHDIQMTLISVLPLSVLEISLSGLIEDLQSVSEPDTAKQLLESPVGTYVMSIHKANLAAQTLMRSGAQQPPSPPTQSPPDYPDYLCAFARQIVNSTRKDQITRRQIEVIRDELFGVIFYVFIAACLLITLVFAILALFQNLDFWWFRNLKVSLLQYAYVAALGGICGACFSAATRVGNISQSGVTGRNLGQLAGAGRPLFHTSLFGCLAAVILCLLVYEGGMSQLGPFKFEIGGTGGNGINKDMIPLLIGLIAGFSERLIPDVIDQFKKKKE